MNNTKTVSVKIFSQDFQVQCPPEAESELYNAAHYLDKKMREVRGAGRGASVERIAIMAALNLSHELLAHKNQKEEGLHALQKQLQHLQNKIDNALIKD